MSETRFTPGPWEAYKLGSGHWRVFTPYWPQRLPVVELDHSRDGYEPFREIETPATAHLIATAPELYAALERLYKRTLFEDEHNGLANNFMDDFAECERVLAKARGEAQIERRDA